VRFVVVGGVDLKGAVVAAHRTALDASVVKLNTVRAELAVAAIPGARHDEDCLLSLRAWIEG
jgi:hypothetical protein